jgi:tripartite-type tricarboxylate transporter receptor subunit TctC
MVSYRPTSRKFRRRFLQLAGVFLATPMSAWAVDYPVRPIRWIIGFPPGGGADVVARIMGRWLSDRLGQEVIIENRPGASTNIAAQAVVNSPPDGYTLLWIGTTNAINATLYQNLSFDFVKDIAPVAGLVVYPLVLEVHPSLPVRNLDEFIAFAKANPGRINYGSYGTGTTSHLAGELLKTMAGIKITHVPYRGGAPMLNDLIGGQVQAGFDVVANSLPHIHSGALRALAVTTPTRVEALPDVPTIGDLLPGYEAIAWTGIGVPRRTPDEIVSRLNGETNAGLADSSIKARLAELSTTPILQSPAEFAAFVAAETEKWAKVVKFSGARVE